MQGGDSCECKGGIHEIASIFVETREFPVAGFDPRAERLHPSGDVVDRTDGQASRNANHRRTRFPPGLDDDAGSERRRLVRERVRCID